MFKIKTMGDDFENAPERVSNRTFKKEDLRT